MTQSKDVAVVGQFVVTVVGQYVVADVGSSVIVAAVAAAQFAVAVVAVQFVDVAVAAAVVLVLSWMRWMPEISDLRLSTSIPGSSWDVAAVGAVTTQWWP